MGDQPDERWIVTEAGQCCKGACVDRGDKEVAHDLDGQAAAAFDRFIAELATLRETIAQEIETAAERVRALPQPGDFAAGHASGLEHAARIARGTETARVQVDETKLESDSGTSKFRVGKLDEEGAIK